MAQPSESDDDPTAIGDVDGLPDIDELFGSTRAWLLDDDVVHTNQGSFGGITRATHEAVVAARTRVATNPMRFFNREFHPTHERAVAAVARLVGADPGATTLVPNATAGMDVALRVLPWRQDATIVTTDQTYLSVAANLDRRATACGARVVAVPTDPFDPDGVAVAVVTAVDDALARGGPVGVVVDQVASATACPFPVADIVAACRAHDVTVVVDGAHAPGQFAPAECAVGADAWTGNLHKWAGAPPTLAALVVDPRHHEAVGAVVPTWYDALAFPGNSVWQGTSDAGPLLVAEQVVAQARAVHARADEIEARAVAGATALADAVGGQVMAGRGWMRTVVLPERLLATRPVACAMVQPPVGVVRQTPLDLAARAVEQWLGQRHIEAKVTPWGERLLLRLSCHAYTSSRDHDRLATGLVDLLEG